MTADVIPHIGDSDTLYWEQGKPQKHSRLVVQQLVPPTSGDELRDYDCDHLSRIRFMLLLDVIDKRRYE
jgi:hypothetical protein